MSGSFYIMGKIIKRILLAALVAVVLLALWITIDLNYGYKVDITNFNPDEIARLDTAMWRSYYNGERFKLFRELGETLESQFHFPFWRRQLVAFYAARAAFVFKDGKTREDYEKALPDLRKFFSHIHDISETNFDVETAAKLELEWWIVHRERKDHAPGDLSIALSDAASALYDSSAYDLKEYGDTRARAMRIRDEKAETGGVTEPDWQKIDELLHRSWRALHIIVSNK